MRLLLFFVLLGCSTHEKHEPTQDWEEIYRKELILAVENEDVEAWYFFLPEYIEAINEKSKSTKSSKKIN